MGVQFFLLGKEVSSSLWRRRQQKKLHVRCNKRWYRPRRMSGFRFWFSLVVGRRWHFRNGISLLVTFEIPNSIFRGLEHWDRRTYIFMDVEYARASPRESYRYVGRYLGDPYYRISFRKFGMDYSHYSQPQILITSNFVVSFALLLFAAGFPDLEISCSTTLTTLELALPHSSYWS